MPHICRSQQMWAGVVAESCERTAYYRARYYNSLTGRFLGRDPLGGKPIDPKTLHKYLYAGGDPVNRIDPSGRDIVENVLLFLRNPAVIAVTSISAAACFLGYEVHNYYPNAVDEVAYQIENAYCDIVAGLGAAIGLDQLLSGN